MPLRDRLPEEVASSLHPPPPQEGTKRKGWVMTHCALPLNGLPQIPAGLLPDLATPPIPQRLPYIHRIGVGLFGFSPYAGRPGFPMSLG